MSSREITTMEIGESSTSDRTWGLCTSSETDQLIQKVYACKLSINATDHPCLQN